MSREPRRVDLSFLNEEEAKQIFRVLERDSQLKRAEKERISKLHKEKEGATGLPGVTGDWFEEIQKRKFQNEADVGKMFKQPLVHRLRKSIGNDAKPSTPPPIPQAQKNASPSILGGLRMPFASLFSSFRKSKRQHSKPLQKQPQYPPRYDPFAAGSHMSSKVEEMAKIETCDSPLPSELANKGPDSNQAEMIDDSTCTWNEQLENELLRVLGSLDDQLAQEQSRGEAGNRRTPTDTGSRAPDTDPYSTLTRSSFLGGVQRNERSMFLSDGTRTLQATDEHKPLFRPRVPCDTYTKRQHVQDGTFRDVYGRSSPVLKRGNSVRSLGHSSEGSLHLPPGQRSSGFGHKDFMPRDSVGRSYSLSCLARRPSLTSVDQLSAASPQHPLDGNRVFAPRNYRQHPRRTPLSSIVWNTPPPFEVYPDGLLRTQSLMEFGPVFEDPYPCSLQKDTRYEFYRTKANYRRAVPVKNNPIFADRPTDPLGFDNRENFLLHQLGMNPSKPRYRYPSFHGKMSLSRKSFPSGRIGERLPMPAEHHYYNNEVFVAPDADVERIPPNPRNWEGAYAKQMGLQSGERDAQRRVMDYVRKHIDRSEGVQNKPFVKYSEGGQTCPALDLSVRKGQTEFVAQRQNPFIRAGQASSKVLAKHFDTKRNFKTEEEMGPDRVDKMDSGGNNEVRLISDPEDTLSPTETLMPPCKNSPQSGTSVKPPHLLCSKSDSITDTGSSYLSNIHNRTGQRNEGDCAINSDLNQAPTPELTGNNPRTSILHLLEREGSAMESLGALTTNKAPGNICSSTLSRGPKVLVKEELPYPCTENFNKCNRFVKHTTSNSVTGSPSNSPPKSPVAYYTLPRKSASIDGSIISEKPISSAKQILFKNNKAVGDNLETIASNRMGGKFPNHRAKSFLLSSAHSSLSSSPKDVTCNLSPAKGNPSLITQEPSQSVGSNNGKGKSTIIQSPDKAEISVLSEYERTDAGNPLKQYKTTSTLTVSIEEDNVKYHELISVYYTLPRKQSRTLSNLFVDDNRSTESSLPKGKFEVPQKKYEVRIGLGRVAFPSALEKEGKADSPVNMTTAPNLSQNAKTSDDANKKDFCVLKPIAERAGASLGKLHNREGVFGSPVEMPDLAFSNRVVSHGPSGDPKPSETMNESVTTSRQCKVHIFKLPSQLREESKVDSSLSHSSSNTADIRQDVEVKERACYRGPSISKKGNGFQSRSENIGSSTDEAFVSEAKVYSEFQDQTLQVDATSTVDPALQPNQSSLEYAKKQKETLRNSLLQNDCTNAERLVRNSADNSKDQAVGTAQDLPDSSGTENKLILDSTKASDIEKRKNRPSIKNKLAAMYKTSRKFSSKKSSSPKPPISNIFSLNNAPLETSHPHRKLISPDVPPSLLQAGNENQNRNPLADEFNNMGPDKPDSEKPQTNEGSPLLTNEVRRPFTNLCNQKRESPRIETPQNSTALFPKGSMSATSNNSQTDDGLENISCSVSSRITVADSKQMKKDVNVGEHLFFPLSPDKTPNILNKNCSKISPPQKMTSPTEYDHHPNIKEPNRLRKLSRPYIEPVLNPSKAQRERHFSESSYTRAPCDRLASRSNLISHGNRYNRKFKSHSELLTCDENENWETGNESYKTFGSRRVLYPSIEFGIFGKEQQQAFLDNIKRSLTEGRLWSPCLLKNSSSLRKEEDSSLNRSQLLSSLSVEKNTSTGDSHQNEPVDVHGEDPTDYSDSDSSTTTDDEYYLDENDKESEL